MVDDDQAGDGISVGLWDPNSPPTGPELGGDRGGLIPPELAEQLRETCTLLYRSAVQTSLLVEAAAEANDASGSYKEQTGPHAFLTAFDKTYQGLAPKPPSEPKAL